MRAVPRRIFVHSLLAFLCAAEGTERFALPAARAAQDEPRRDAADVLARRLSYLVRKPHNVAAFDAMVADASEGGAGLEALIGAWEVELQGATIDDATAATACRIVLARLHAHAGAVDTALEVLEVLEGSRGSPELCALSAELLAAAGRTDESLEAIERGLSMATERELRRRLYEAAAAVHATRGAAASVAAAYESLAGEAPGDFGLRLDVAASLARHGLTEQAIEQYRAAQQLAGEDAERASRVLTELGRLFELSLDGAAAIESYLQAEELLARGHWRTNELTTRLIELHRRAGTLAELVERRRAATLARPQALAPREALAEALVANGETAEAAEVLASAAADFPDDLQLARRRVDLARELGQPEVEVAELQRALGLRPEDVRLRFELGRALAQLGRSDSAQAQFDRLQRARSDAVDGELFARVARVWQEAQEPARARAAWEAALALEPQIVDRHLDLARFDVAQGQRDAAFERLVETLAGLDLRASDLERVADFYEDEHERGRAADALAQAVALDASDGRRLHRLAKLLSRLSREAQARGLLRELMNLERDPSRRDVAAGEYVSLLTRGDARVRALREEEAQIATGATMPAPYLIVAELRARASDSAGARLAIAQLVAARPEDLDARLALARALVKENDAAGALAEYEELVERFPKRRRVFLLESVRLYEELGRREEAVRTLDKLAQGAAENARALGDIAAGYTRLGRPAQAAELLERSLRIDPDQIAARRSLARLSIELGRTNVARAQLERAYATAQGKEREAIVDELRSALGAGRRYDAAIEDLRSRARDNPYDRVSSELAAELLLAAGQPEDAGEILAAELASDPWDVRLLELRVRVSGALGRSGEVVSDLELLLLLEGVDVERVRRDLIGAYIEFGDPAHALVAARELSEPLEAAKVLAKGGRVAEAIVLLEEEVEADRGGPDVWRELGRMHHRRADASAAILAFERYLESVPDDVVALRTLGDMYFDRGNTERVLAVGRRLIEEGGTRVAGIEEWFRKKKLLTEYLEIRAEIVLTFAADADAVRSGIDALLKRREGAAVGIGLLDRLDSLYAAGDAPSDFEPEAWSHFYREWRLVFFLRDRRLARARLKELRNLLEQEGVHPRDEWFEYVVLLGQGIKIWRYDWALMEKALAQHPEHLAVVGLIGKHAFDSSRFDLAAELFGRADELLSSSAFAERVAAAQHERWLEHLTSARVASAPDSTADEILSHARATYSPVDEPGAHGTLPEDPLAARWWRGVALVLAGEKRTGEDVLRSLEPDDPHALAAWIAVARAWALAGRADSVDRIYEHLIVAEAELDEICRTDEWREPLDEFWPELAKHLERAKRYVEAYDLLRRANLANECLELVQRRDLGVALIELYAGQFDALLAALPEVPGATQLERLWVLGTKLAEVQELDGRHADALETRVVLADRLPPDIDLFERAARIAERVQDHGVTLHLLRRKVELRRELATRPRSDQGHFRGGLVPFDFSRAGSLSPSIRTAQTLPSGTKLVRIAGRTSGSPRNDIVDDLMSMLEIQIELEDLPAARRTLHEMLAAGVALDTTRADRVAQLVLADEKLERDVDVLGVLYRLKPESLGLMSQYSLALIRAGRLDEALDALDAFPDPGRASGTIRRRLKQIDEARAEAESGEDR